MCMCKCSDCGCLHAWGLGIALGVSWALGILLLGLAAWLGVMDLPWLPFLCSVYMGYAPTLIGSLYGALWAFADMFISGVIIAWIYNCVTCCMCKACKDKPKEGDA